MNGAKAAYTEIARHHILCNGRSRWTKTVAQPSLDKKKKLKVVGSGSERAKPPESGPKTAKNGPFTSLPHGAERAPLNSQTPPKSEPKTAKNGLFTSVPLAGRKGTFETLKREVNGRSRWTKTVAQPSLGKDN